MSQAARPAADRADVEKRSSEDLSRFFKGLAPGTLQGLEALTSYAFWCVF